MSKRHIYTLLLPIACAAIACANHLNADESNDASKVSSKSLYSVSCFTNNEKSDAFDHEALSRIATVYVDDDKLQAVRPDFDDTTIAQVNAQAAADVSQPVPQSVPTAAPTLQNTSPGSQEGPVINFNNVSITEFLRFVSRLTGKNFIFDPQELQFPVTIISETPATLDQVMAALLQNLRIHNFYLIEEGNNFVIYSNTSIKAPAGLLYRDQYGQERPDVVTQVYQVTNVTPDSIATVIRSMTSPDAVVEIIESTMTLVVTDFLPNIRRITDLIKKLDNPATGLEIGQYVALNNSPAALISVASRILLPIAADKPLIFIPYQASNSVFIVSTASLVEKSLSVMQALDLNIGVSGMMNVDQLKFDIEAAKKLQEERVTEEQRERTKEIPVTQEELDILSEQEKYALLLSKGYSPEQISKLTPQQVNRILREKGVSQVEREKILGKKKGLFESELPLGQVESTQFLIHKLQYRKAETVANALQAISVSLQGGPTAGSKASVQTQSDLVVTLNSVQTIDETNSIVFTGTRATLQKVKELLTQVDTPVRQVFIEALVIDTTLTESLHFGVEWAAKLQRKNFAGQTGLITDTSAVGPAVQAIGFPPSVPTDPPTVLTPIPLNEGFSVNGIGRKIKFHGQGLIAGAALINLLRDDQNSRVLLNPKIVTEHNVPAELFVGAQVPIKGQSIVNATTSTISNTVSTNFTQQQVGVSLKVTPLISSNDMVTLIIELSISSASQEQVNAQGQNNAPPATVKEITSKTRVHIPSDYFLIMSGMLSDTNTRNEQRFPILGSIPILGFFFSNKLVTDDRRNVIMYLRPKIVDSTFDMEQLTQKEDEKEQEASKAHSGIRGNLNDLKELLNF